MSISVVIPFFNSAATLETCLAAVSKANPAPDEVLLVDDASTDESLKIASAFPFRIIKNEKNLGRGEAKNVGATAAKGDIIVFVDSDVEVDAGVFGEIARIFSAQPDLAVVSGIPSAKSPYNNFPSQFKAAYMRFVLENHSGEVEYAHGCIQAYRRFVFDELGLRFDTQLHCDDVDFGLRLSCGGGKLFLSPDITGIHHRYYSWYSLLRNDFLVPYEFARLAVKYRKIQSAAKQSRFAHASLRQVVAVGIAPLILAGVILLPLIGCDLIWLIMSLLILNFLCNWPIFLFFKKQHGLLWSIAAACYNILDQVVMFLGMGWGIVCTRTKLSESQRIRDA